MHSISIHHSLIQKQSTKQSMNRTAMATTKSFLLYLLTSFSVVILAAYIYYNTTTNATNPINTLKSEHELNQTIKIWPELKFSWRTVLATVIGFLGSGFGTVGGVGGGGIFVPMLTLLLGFDTKSAAALSKCMIMGASASSVWYNLRVSHPIREAPIIDYDLALLFQPMLMLGITVGVSLSVVFPYWLITLLIIFLFAGTSSRSFFKGVEMWKEESIFKKEMAQRSHHNSHGELYELLDSREEKSPMQLMCFNINFKKLVLLITTWTSFLLLQVFKSNASVCGKMYWALFIAQFPIAASVFGYEAVKLYREHNRRMLAGNLEHICEATIQWNVVHLAFCALCGLVGGTVGGLLGSGGGFILGPLLLEIGVIPQVASATATFVMMFSSSLSVAEFYLLKRFPIPYALYLTCVSMMAGFWGQFFIRKLIAFLRRASIIVFILSAVIFASALTMGVIGIENSFEMIKKHEFMGFLPFCESQ